MYYSLDGINRDACLADEQNVAAMNVSSPARQGYARAAFLRKELSVLNLRRFSSLVLVLAVLLLPLAVASAQESASTTKDLLRQGITEYKAKNFTTAKAVLEKINPAGLSAGNRRTLGEYLANSTADATLQAADEQIYRDAVTALRAGKSAEAAAGFRKIASSPVLRQATLDSAKTQLAQAQKAGTVAPVPAPAAGANGNSEASNKLIALIEAQRRQVAKLIADGKALMVARDFRGAQIAFEKALALDKDNAEAQALRDQAVEAIELKRRTDIIDRTGKRVAIQKQISDLEFDKAMDRALRLLDIADSRSDYDSAELQIQIANDTLKKNESLYSIEDLRAKRKLITERTDKLDSERAKWEEVQVAKKINQLEILRITREARIKAEKDRKLERLVDIARALINRGSYKQADEELSRILVIDPEHSWAMGQRETLSNLIVMIDEKQIVKDDMYQTQQALVDIRRSAVPWWEQLRYPSDWKELSLRRKRYAVGATTESEADRETRHRLRQKLPKLDFANVPFELVVQFLREVSGVSIYVNWRALQVASVDKTTEVNVHLIDVSFEKALRIILGDVSGPAVGTPTQVDFVIDEGVIHITTREALSHQTITRVYDIRDIIIPTPTINMPRRIGLQGMSGRGGGGSGGGVNQGGRGGGGGGGAGGGGGGIGGGGLIGGGGGGGGGDQAEDKSQEELLSETVDLIKDTIARDSWEQGGAIRPMGGQLVVTQTAENHEALLDLISQLRESKTLQIAIEARFITVTSGFLNHIGLDLDLYFNLDSGLGGGGFVLDPVTGASVPQLGTSMWKGGSYTDADGNLVQAVRNTNVWRGGNSLTPVGVVSGSGSGRGIFPQTGMAGDIGASVAADAISLGGTFLDDVQVDFLLRATQAYNQNKTMTAPRLTLLNGQAATLNIQTESAYIEDIETESNFNDNFGGGRESNRRDYEIGYYNTGTSLFVRGTVSADRRYVTMTIVPQLQRLVSLTEIPAEFGPTGEPLAFIQLPSLQVLTLVSTVSVPDGGTLLLGGQKLSGEVEQERGVPLLSKVPFINRLFTNRSMARDESTLLILVKPKIIIQREEEEMRDLQR